MAIATMGLASFLSLGGCATLFGNHNRSVQINSNPEGATVTLNGMNVGNTPTHVVIQSTMSTNVISVKKQGYKVSQREIATSFQPVGFLNVFFWPGFIVDAVTGDMMKLNTHFVTVNLAKKS